MALPAHGEECIAAVHKVGVHYGIRIGNGRKAVGRMAEWRVDVILQVDDKEHLDGKNLINNNNNNNNNNSNDNNTKTLFLAQTSLYFSIVEKSL